MFLKNTVAQLLLVAFFAALSGCGGGAGVSGKNQKDSSKKEAPATASEDQVATDPQVVTGAYLACEFVTQPTGAGNVSVGCNVMSNQRKLVLQAPLSTEHAGVVGANKIASQSSSQFQALYSIPSGSLNQTRLSAKIFNGTSSIKELSCDGSQIPCGSSPNLTEFSLNTVGMWTASSSFSDAASKQALAPNCPNYPEMYCDQGGRLLNTSPSAVANADTRQNCMTSSQSVISNIIKIGTGGLFDPRLMFDNKPQAMNQYVLKQGQACVVPKIAATGRNPQLANAGQGCILVMVRTPEGRAQNLIIPRSNILNPDEFTRKLSQFQCR